MKTIGLLGGMSWESTSDYYRLLNQHAKKILGGFHSAQIVLYSVDFAPIEKLQQRGDWEAAGEILVEAARSIEKAGADFLLICTNTMHKLAETVQGGISIPLLHIGDATGRILQDLQISSVGLLGTAFTMEQDFYRGRLEKQYNMTVYIPEERDRQLVHNVIYNELCQGIRKESSQREYLRIIDSLANRGAEAVILGCTEIGMLVKQADSRITLLDTTAIHVQEAVKLAFEQ